MWILESGWGASILSREHMNYAGMKYRNRMQSYATPIEYEAHDGRDTYCKFASLENFILGFWVFLAACLITDGGGKRLIPLNLSIS